MTIKCNLVATVRSNGQQSLNFICIDSGASVRIEDIRPVVEDLGGYLEPYTHQTINRFINYYVCLPDMESYNAYITYCKLME